MCGQVSRGDTRCGKSYLGQELAVVAVSKTELHKIDNLGSSPGGNPLHSPCLTCCVIGTLGTVSTGIKRGYNTCRIFFFFFFFFFFYLTYSRWTSSLPSCLWSQRIFPSFPVSRLTTFYRDASSALLQLVNQWLNFTYYSRSHAFRYERKNTNPTLVRIELTTSVLADVQLTY